MKKMISKVREFQAFFVKSKRLSWFVFTPISLASIFLFFQNFATNSNDVPATPMNVIMADLGEGSIYPILIPLPDPWSSIERQLTLLPDMTSKIAAAKAAGLTVNVVDDGSLDGSLFYAFTDPASGTTVMSYSQMSEINLTNLPNPWTGIVLPNSSYDFESNYVCQYKNVGLFAGFIPALNGTAFNSILSPGITAVQITFTSSVNNPAPNNWSANVSSNMANAALDLTHQLGLQFNTSTASGVTADQVAQTVANATTASISVSCGNTKNSGYESTEITKSGLKVAKIVLNCSEACGSSDASDGAFQVCQTTLEHEIMHALGFAHDPYNDNMNYSPKEQITHGVPGPPSYWNVTLPDGAKDVVQSLIGKQNLNLNFQNACKPAYIYHLASCALNSRFEYCCAGGSTNPDSSQGCGQNAAAPPMTCDPTGILQSQCQGSGAT